MIENWILAIILILAAMKSGWKECPEIPHAQSLSMMQMMDFIRRQLGISYEEIQISQIPDMIESTADSQDVIVNETISVQNADNKIEEAGTNREEEASIREGEAVTESRDPQQESEEQDVTDADEDHMSEEEEKKIPE